MSTLVVVVPSGRKRCGRALLLAGDGSTRIGPFKLLATASAWAARLNGNETRDWRKRFGHPPTGTYVIAGSLPPGASPHPKRWRRFGKLGALILLPVGGDALEARGLGRRRFLLHGGPTDARRRLRPTFGGLRLRNRDLEALLRAINDANEAGDPLSTVEVAETESPTWSGQGKRDRAGRLRPAFASPEPRQKPKMGVQHAALIALGFGVSGGRVRGGRLVRRDFIGLALLTMGALGASACAAGPEVPSPDPAPGQRLGKGGPAAGPADGGDDGAAPGEDGGAPYGGYDTDAGSSGFPPPGGEGDYSGYDNGASGAGGIG